MSNSQAATHQTDPTASSAASLIAAPNSASETATASDPRAFRNALGRFGTGVAIITTRHPDGRPLGVTVNSFASVSLDPPLVQFSLAWKTSSLPVFEQSSHFSVNILAQSQAGLSWTFTKPATAVWEDIACTEGANGCMALADSLAVFECERHMRVEAGDHVIYIGRVTAFHNRAEESEPLLFYRGGYGAFVRAPA
jgi:flavin reductase (DIM6/NTAB) family NADH-FMN oxidoreductase RutF